VPPVIVADTPVPIPLALGQTLHGFTQISSDAVTSLHFVWAADRIATGADHMTQIVLGGGNLVWIGPVGRIEFSNGHLDFSGSAQAAEVVRVYATILGREPDAAGLINWTEHLQHGESLAQVAEGFFGSAEFIARFAGLSNEALVVNLYREALGRVPDASGLAHQVAAIDAGLPRAQLIANFLQSGEAVARFEASHTGGIWVQNSNATLVGMAYDAVFDRAPDPVGLAGWTAQLASGAMSVRGMVAAIADSDEFRARHAQEDDRAYVASVYHSALEREPDPEGLANWTEYLAKHVMDRVDVVMLIGLSDEQKLQFSQHPHGDAFF
jgi:hypothetical protein